MRAYSTVQQLLGHGSYCDLILSLALAHDEVAIAVLHKHHPIIRVGAGLIQFVYRSHLRLTTEATRNRHAFSPFFARVHEHEIRHTPAT